MRFAGYYSGFAVNPEDTSTVVCVDDGPIDLLDRFTGNPPEGGTWTPPLASGTNLFDPNVDTFSEYLYEVSGICADVSVTINVTLQSSPNAFDAHNIETCPDLLEANMRPDQNVATVNLSDRDLEVSGGATGVRVVYYQSFEDASANENAIESPNAYSTMNGSENIYARVFDTTAGCGSNNITAFSIEIFPSPYTTLSKENDLLCIDTTTGIANTSINIDATVENSYPDTVYNYHWSKDGLFFSEQPMIEVINGGLYELEINALYPNGVMCEFSAKTIFVETSSPVFEIRTIEESFTLEGTYTLEVFNISGVNPDTIYEWSLDNGPFQLDTLFYNIAPGDHTIVGRAITQACGEYSQVIEIIDYPRFFTPNSDGINDTWNIINLDNAPNLDAKIYIFDRYGKLLKQIKSTSAGWDGTFNKQSMPSSDYWFRVEFTEPNDLGMKRIVNGHFTLKK
ncbi:T9SS type B sorting domain-containing protein [Dokdonia sp. Hel_I_53]|uniref:T9SS type B sorting domain-containing protein n=1 Tax=Dokdonia sp. Hel_I_53 TaxID=1566287 RepID=UPI0011A8EF79|nr:T9SS type B sorting domain-containing protein [Dokdonia sp. Hel_I_53]